VTTTVRSVRVELEMGIAGYVANARIAGRETDAAFGRAEERISATSQAVSRLERNTSNLARTSTDARVQQSTLGREVDKVGTSAGRAERSIDKYSGRLRVLTDLALIGGPALLRLGAGALPAIAAGIVGIGAGAAGIGVAVLALHGLSDALKALNTYELEPTAQNLQALRIEEEKLGPAGAQFLHYLDDLEPQLKDIQNVARAGLFPGVEDGIDSLLTRLPLVRQIVNRVSRELGRLASDAGSALASDEWTPFFEYVRSNAAPILDDFARSAGNVALGLGNILVAFDPLTQRFTGGLEDMTSRFAEWSKHLEDDQGFQDFLDTVEEAGPELVAFLGSAVQLLAGLARASAPLGAVTLPALTAIVNLLGSIANSPIGPGLYTAAAGLLAFNRASSIAEKSSARLQGTWAKMGRAQLAGSAAGGLALLATSLTDVDDKAGLANTTMYASAGLMVGGPWGLAIGAAIGQVKDFADAYSQAEDAIAKADDALHSNNIKDTRDSLKDLQDQLDREHPDDHTLANYMDAVTGSFHDFTGQTSDIEGRISELEGSLKQGGDAADLFGETIGQTGDQLRVAATDARAFSGALAELNGWFDKRDAVRGYKDAIDELRTSIKDGFTREDAANLDAIGTSILQVAQNIKSPKVRGEFLAGARAQLVEMANHAAPKAAAAIQEIIDKFDDKGLTHPPEITPKVETGPAKTQADDLRRKVERDFDIMDGLSSKPTIDADDNPFKQTYGSVKAAMAQADRLRAKPKVDVDPGNSLGILGSIVNLLGHVTDRSATVRITTIKTPGGKEVPLPGGADGMTVPGQRAPYGDKVLIHAAPGEEIISNRHGQADRFRADRASGRIPAYAAGGTVEDRIRGTYTTRYRGDGDRGPTWHGNGGDDAAGRAIQIWTNGTYTIEKALKALKAELDQDSKALDKHKSSLEGLISQRDSTASSIASAALHDPFGNGLAGFDAQVDADTGDIEAMTAALAALVQNGLDPKSALYQQLAASMDVNTAQQLAALSSGDLASRAQRFQQRADEAGAFGAGVAGQAFNDAIREETKATRELRETVRDLHHAVNQMEDRVEKGAERGAHKGTKSGSAEGTEAGTRAGQDEKRRRTATFSRTGGGSR
jgi:hypothetical protein